MNGGLKGKVEAESLDKCVNACREMTIKEVLQQRQTHLINELSRIQNQIKLIDEHPYLEETLMKFGVRHML